LRAKSHRRKGYASHNTNVHENAYNYPDQNEKGLLTNPGEKDPGIVPKEKNTMIRKKSLKNTVCLKKKKGQKKKKLQGC